MRQQVTALCGLLLFGISCSVDAAGGPTTFCNPINIDYRFSFDAKLPHREAADPTMVVHNGTYWLFASKSGGYWHSTDMNDWTLVVPTGLPLEDYAPMVVVLGDGRFYYTAFNSQAIYSTADPHGGNWSRVASMGHYGDPGMLVDDDARVYMYSGCSRNGTIRAVQLDNVTWQEVPGTAATAIEPDPYRRGFEVGGDNNELLAQAPYVEGAFMNKINGLYYLQYAVPGTQYKSYADGLFVGHAPLGPFTFQAHSPLSSRLVGFAAGAGHGSTYAVPASGGVGGVDSYYHISTSTISVRAMFERRLVIHPLIAVDPALLWVDSYLGDYPHALPHAQAAAAPTAAAARASAAGGLRVGAAPQWMLLSLNKSAAASSGANPALAFNEDIRTWWSADTGEEGEWLAVDLGGRYTVNAVQVNFADEGCSLVGTRPDAADAYKYYVEYCTDTGGAAGACAHWKVADALDRRANTRDLPHDYVELRAPLAAVTQLRINNAHMPGGAKFSLSGLRVFGLGPDGGAAPAAVPASAVQVVRDAADPRHATVSWSAAQGAEFYVIRFGIAAQAASKQHTAVHNLQVYGATTAELRSLVVGENYEFIVDAINSNGVTYGEEPKE